MAGIFYEYIHWETNAQLKLEIISNCIGNNRTSLSISWDEGRSLMGDGIQVLKLIKIRQTKKKNIMAGEDIPIQHVDKLFNKGIVKDDETNDDVIEE